jgi:uncharacterized protein (DUF433 family)
MSGNGMPADLDPRLMPLYGIGEAAHYLSVPHATVSSWVKGRLYPTQEGIRHFRPPIRAAADSPWRLSFTNLVEIHVLSGLRKEHRLKLDKVRTALDYVRKNLGVDHPLAHQSFITNGASLFVERFGRLIDASNEGQEAMKQVVLLYARRIDPDADGLAARLYPFTRVVTQNAPKVIAIDPKISLGRPFIEGTGVPTSVLAERYKAGDSIEELAEDYQCETADVQEAIRCELDLRIAA